MGLQPGYMGLQPGRIGLQPLLHGLAASATRGCSPAVSALKLKPVSWPTTTAPTSDSLATALPSAAMLVLASFESGSDNGRLNALDRAVSTSMPASCSSSTRPLAPMTKTFLISGLFRAIHRAATNDDGTT